MEEKYNEFLNYNPQYKTENTELGNVDTLDPSNRNVFTNWFYPQQAEAAAFQRENFFVDKENAFNEYMWNKSNEYNSPEAQMMRYKAAGINPLLAAAGITQTGNATATPMQGATGNVGMNTTGENPINTISQLIGGITNGINGASQLGELLGFGKKNKAEIKQMHETANKAAKEANLTYWQTYQFRRTMDVLKEQLENNNEQTKQNILNLQKLYEVYDQQKWNIAADTNLKEAETGKTDQETKSLEYQNFEAEFKKAFRDTFGINLTSSGLEMLVNAVMRGKGKPIINAIASFVTEVADTATDNTTKIIENIIKNHYKAFIGNPTKRRKELLNKVIEYIKNKRK